jgi:tetrahydromethanopterin S-methyltransferase subunit G
MKSADPAMDTARGRGYSGTMDAGLRGEFERVHAEFERVHARLDSHEERFERLMASVAGLFEAAQTRNDERFDALERRIDGVEQRLESMDVTFTEKFIGVDERFGTLRLANKQFESRFLAALGVLDGRMSRVEGDIGVLAERAAGVETGLAGLDRRLTTFAAEVNERIGGLGAEVVGVNRRLDGLSDDMRQRFRLVN